jgi:hypothetical protein
MLKQKALTCESRGFLVFGFWVGNGVVCISIIFSGAGYGSALTAGHYWQSTLLKKVTRRKGGTHLSAIRDNGYSPSTQTQPKKKRRITQHIAA